LDETRLFVAYELPFAYNVSIRVKKEDVYSDPNVELWMFLIANVDHIKNVHV